MSNGNAAIVRHETPATVTAIVDSRNAVAPRNIEDVWRMANTVAKSGLYGVKSADEAMIRMATGMELGLSPMQSIRGVYVINSKGVSRPSMSADMMVAICKNHSDLCEYFRLVESTGKIATYETKRRDEPKPVRMSWTIEQAKAAGLAGKDNWAAHPDAMLRARASSALARAVYQDLLNGLYDPDELDAPAAPMQIQATSTEVVASVVASIEPSFSNNESPAVDLVANANECTTLEQLEKLWRSNNAVRKKLSSSEQEGLAAFFKARSEEITKAIASAPVVVVEAAQIVESESAEQ